jgi:tRNA(His) 5'-end guanylyltransferase
MFYKPLSKLLTKILTSVKERVQMYCATVYARSGVNQMVILKSSKEPLEGLKSPIFSHICSIKTYDFTTLYTTIPHDKLKTKFFGIINSCFFFNKNGKRKIQNTHI